MVCLSKYFFPSLTLIIFRTFFIVSIFDFEQVIVGWEGVPLDLFRIALVPNEYEVIV